MPRDPEFYGLLNGVQNKNIPGHNYRGYSILGEENGREIAVSTFHRRIKYIITKTYDNYYTTELEIPDFLRSLKPVNVKYGMYSLVWEVNGLVWAVIY